MPSFNHAFEVSKVLNSKSSHNRIFLDGLILINLINSAGFELIYCHKSKTLARYVPLNVLRLRSSLNRTFPDHDNRRSGQGGFAGKT
jgi:hypothetical protein